MKISISAAPLLLCLAFAFAAGWLLNDRQATAKLQRITEERDLTLDLVKTAMSMSEKSLTHSLDNAAVLEVCLGKIGLRPATVVPTKHDTRLAQLSP